MGFEYYGGFGTPMINYVNQPLIYFAVVIVAAILGVVLFFTFLNEKNEGKFNGSKEKIYNFLNFNRFYAEKIVKFIYVVTAVVLTLLGITQIVLGAFISGLVTIILGNVMTRIGAELFLMFIMLCKKTVSIDKRLSDKEKFYNDTQESSGCCGERETDDQTV